MTSIEIINKDDPFKDLYPTCGEAHRAGTRSGQHDALSSAISRLAWISVRYEKAGDTAKFHCAEECIADVRKLRDLLEKELA